MFSMPFKVLGKKIAILTNKSFKPRNIITFNAIGNKITFEITLKELKK